MERERTMSKEAHVCFNPMENNIIVESLSELDRNLTSYEKQMRATWPTVVANEDHVWFVENLERNATDGGDLIYLRDVKNFVMFNVTNDIAPTFVDFFWTLAVDRFLRALVVYFQYFLQVWDIIQYRTKNRGILIRHPVSAVREGKWRKWLNNLRYIVAREYCAILDGKDDATYYHHMGPHRRNRSMAGKDNLIFELLYSYSRKVVELVLGELENPVIFDEMERLFRPTDYFCIKGFRDKISEIDRQCLEDPIDNPVLLMDAPIIRELYRFGRNPILCNLGHFANHPVETDDSEMKMLQMMYLCSESHLIHCNIKIGLLGQERGKLDISLKRCSSCRLNVCFVLRETVSYVPRYDPTLEKETFAPSFIEGQPQKCELEDLVTYDYDRKSEAKKWKRYLKFEDRFLTIQKQRESSFMSDIDNIKRESKFRRLHNIKNYNIESIVAQQFESIHGECSTEESLESEF